MKIQLLLNKNGDFWNASKTSAIFGNFPISAVTKTKNTFSEYNFYILSAVISFVDCLVFYFRWKVVQSPCRIIFYRSYGHSRLCSLFNISVAKVEISSFVWRCKIGNSETWVLLKLTRNWIELKVPNQLNSSYILLGMQNKTLVDTYQKMIVAVEKWTNVFCFLLSRGIVFISIVSFASSYWEYFTSENYKFHLTYPAS